VGAASRRVNDANARCAGTTRRASSSSIAFVMNTIQPASAYAYMHDHDPIEITVILRGGPPTTIDGIETPPGRVLCRAPRYRALRRLQDLRCVEHNRRPHLIASGPSADHLTFSVGGCCPGFVAIATTRLD